MATSRLIVKNLPKTVNETTLRDLFSKQGVVTDVQLKYTPDGKFRSFAFVGFKSPDEANAAIGYHNNTYIGATKIAVEACVKLGDPSKPKAWSKHAPEKLNKLPKRKLSEDEDETPKKLNKKKTTESEILEKCEEDPDFLEFLESHRKKSAWGNDTIIDELEKLKASVQKKDVKEKPKEDTSDIATNKDSKEKKSEKKKKRKNIPDIESGDEDVGADEADDAKKAKKDSKRSKKIVPKAIPQEKYFTIKLRDLPKKAKKQDLKSFFAPLLPKSIRIPPKFRGIAYVGFATSEDRKKAMSKNKSFLLGNRILIRKYDVLENIGSTDEKKTRWVAQEEELVNESETVGESGRIFIRNLSYLTNEDEIRGLFEPFGPVTEVHLPIDRLTRKLKGFGFISFLLPEHAAMAFSELDGTIFQGRMLHLLPSKVREEQEIAPDGSYKKKKEILQKKTAGSSHNWNTLFLGQNAVTNVAADKYGVSREELLLDNQTEEGNRNSSVAVRMALAESEIVDETRKFLESQGVSLAAFENKTTGRSKTCFLVKNLTPKTSTQHLVDLFSKHGELGRVILPSSGVTGIVEFMEPAEARAAFKKLAYTKFEGLPLYLEWAPVDTFSASKEVTEEKIPEESPSEPTPQPKLADPIDEDMVPEPDTTLFVKNLNFDTTEEALKKHFANVGPVYSATIAKKKDSKHPGQVLSMGYGFVQFYRATDASNALKTLQGSMLTNHLLELKRSNRTLQSTEALKRQSGAANEKDAGNKILVRNVPFQATLDEIKNLFSTFGELKACRLPMKFDGTGHRGFAFIDFSLNHEAKRAFDTLSKSTHLYGRRLVLEWAAKNETVDDLRQKTAKQYDLQKKGQLDSEKTSTKRMITRYFQTKSAKPEGEDKDEEDES